MADGMMHHEEIHEELGKLLPDDLERAYLSGICIGIASGIDGDNFALLAEAVRLLRDGHPFPFMIKSLLDRHG